MPNPFDTPSPIADMRLSREEAIARYSASPGDLEKLLYHHTGRHVTKWLHYLPVYEQALSRFRGKPIRMLEIGVFRGGSLELWRKYFGPEATIFGVDLNPACARFVDAPNQVRIGSQADPAFLNQVVDEMGGVDIVLDDGSHMAEHQRASLAALWPRLNLDGVYMIEDTHTSYWPQYDGGYGKPGTAAEMAKGVIDDMHGFFHDQASQVLPREEIGQMLIADSILAITKARRLRPGYVLVGHHPEQMPQDQAQG